MSDVPDDLKYTADHEWVQPGEGATVRIGITDYAQAALGDVVFVQLPDVGASIAKGDAVGEIESTKSVSDIFAPLTGTVAARNEALDQTPEVINTDPYGDGWLFDIEASDDAERGDLLDAAAYGALSG